jgi:hypothetical protein
MVVSRPLADVELRQDRELDAAADLVRIDRRVIESVDSC